jgi:hypothetical protein
MDERAADTFRLDACPVEELLCGRSIVCSLRDGTLRRHSVVTRTVVQAKSLDGYARSAGFDGANRWGSSATSSGCAGCNESSRSRMTAIAARPDAAKSRVAPTARWCSKWAVPNLVRSADSAAESRSSSTP